MTGVVEELVRWTRVPRDVRERAGRAARHAIAKGVLTRPDTCSRCGKTPPRLKGGLPSIQAHHHDYSRPLDVEWICVQCHRDETPHGMAMKTHCRHGHAYEGHNVRMSRGERVCRTCYNAGRNKWWAKRKLQNA